MPNRLTDYEKSEVRRMRNSGMYIADIAKTLGRSPSTVSMVIDGRGWRGHNSPSRDKSTCTHQEVCRFPSGGVLSVSHGLGEDHAKKTMRALTAGFQALPGYPRTEAL